MNESEMSIHWAVSMFSIYEDIITMYKWDVYYLLHGATHMKFTLGIVLQMPTGPAYQLTAGMKLINDLGPIYLNGLRSIRTLTELYAAHLPTFSFGRFGLVEASNPRGHDFLVQWGFTSLSSIVCFFTFLTKFFSYPCGSNGSLFRQQTKTKHLSFRLLTAQEKIWCNGKSM